MPHTLTLTPTELREQLLSPKATDRVHALHALEMAAEQADDGLSREMLTFAARGIPYYSPNDAAYRKWVDKALAYWKRAHAN